MISDIRLHKTKLIKHFEKMLDGLLEKEDKEVYDKYTLPEEFKIELSLKFTDDEFPKTLRATTIIDVTPKDYEIDIDIKDDK